ncbi:MAG: hypothetical protein U0804_19575 [Gemmataceae bacterium]
MVHLVALLTFVALAAASWGVAVVVYRSTAGGPDPAAAPHYQLVRAAAVGAVALTSFMPFHLGYAFGVLAWFSAVFGWLGLPAARAALLVLYLAAASLVARLAVGGAMVAFFP